MTEEDAFRSSFKYYRRRQPSPDLSNVVDFDDLSKISQQHISYELSDPIATGQEPSNATFNISPHTLHVPNMEAVKGLHSVETWKAFTVAEVPGFIFISNPFEKEGKQYWVRRCLMCYTERPNRSNLDPHLTLAPDESIWKTSLKSVGSSPSDVSEIFKSDNSEHYWEWRSMLQTFIRCSERRRQLLDKLRWVTLGYHHNWDTKHYSLDDVTPMPLELVKISAFIASAVGYQNYNAEAAIVNFYTSGSTLAGHTDHSEFDHLSPIISFSFGCTAIFLIGGATKSVRPVAVYVRDGDIIIMSSACRLSYHAVPRIFPHTYCYSAAVTGLERISGSYFPEKDLELLHEHDLHNVNGVVKSTVSGTFNSLISEKTDDVCDISDKSSQDEDQLIFEDYLSASRININVRQVFAQ